jgi:hypothetical protein
MDDDDDDDDDDDGDDGDGGGFYCPSYRRPHANLLLNSSPRTPRNHAPVFIPNLLFTGHEWVATLVKVKLDAC